MRGELRNGTDLMRGAMARAQMGTPSTNAAAGRACEGLALIIVEPKGPAEDIIGYEDIRQRYLAV